MPLPAWVAGKSIVDNENAALLCSSVTTICSAALGVSQRRLWRSLTGALSGGCAMGIGAVGSSMSTSVVSRDEMLSSAQVARSVSAGARWLSVYLGGSGDTSGGKWHTTRPSLRTKRSSNKQRRPLRAVEITQSFAGAR